MPFTEQLGDGATLEMVYIPEGEFLMGSPESEVRRLGHEGPQHKVQVPAFYIGKYPVTQKQWHAVSLMDGVEMGLKSIFPSFKGDHLPMESISWYGAMEFCARLSAFTGRTYTLTSEAQWEYACRAGTDTPFHFGETITTELANYKGIDSTITIESWHAPGVKLDEMVVSGTYGWGSKGNYREQPTPVGQFPANGFGLYDLHGNVWEWCLDDWHINYEGAPADGKAWLEPEKQESSKVLRGGSWCDGPEGCRSACRVKGNPDDRRNYLGFRVVSLPQDS